MKKRAMKKWIPKDTIYCDKCKWRKYIKTIKLHRNINCKFKDNCNLNCWTDEQTSCRDEVYKCKYLGLIDWEQNTLLWDGCKECHVKEDFRQWI